MKVREEDIPRLIRAVDRLAGTRDFSVARKTSTTGNREWHVPNVRYQNGCVRVSYTTHVGSTLVDAFQKMMDTLVRSFNDPLAEAQARTMEVQTAKMDALKLFEDSVELVSEKEIVDSESDLDSLDEAIENIEI